MSQSDHIVNQDEPMLVTGANGFIGSQLVNTLLRFGFTNLRCFVRPASNLGNLEALIRPFSGANVEIIEGNLLSREDCRKATQGVSVIFHLAAGFDKSFPGAFMNSVVTTRNLLDCTLKQPRFKRFVNVSSFAVYSPKHVRRGGMLDEMCEVEQHPVERHEAYCYGKVKQEEMVKFYADTYGTPYVIVRPGAVFGPGQKSISGRIGIDSFGIFLHMGGSNRIPFTYVENCAELIMLSGIKPAVNAMVFNAVDDHLPTSREFLNRYKREVRKFRSIPIPATVSRALCSLWERYSKWSQGQLPPAFNKSRWQAEWKGATYSNRRAKELLGWAPRIPIDEALTRYFEYQKQARP